MIFYITRGALRVVSTFGQCVLFADVLLFQPFRIVPRIQILTSHSECLSNLLGLRTVLGCFSGIIDSSSYMYVDPDATR